MKKPENIKYIEINAIDDFVTNVDTPDTPSNYATAMRGFRNTSDGVLVQKDLGTKAYLSALPTTPSAITITATYTFTDSDGTEYTVVMGYDASTFHHVYITSDLGGTWTEVTRHLSGLIKSVDSDVQITVETAGNAHGLDDSLGGDVDIALNELRSWVCLNAGAETDKQWAICLSNTASAAAATFATVTVCGSLDHTVGLDWDVGDVVHFFPTPASRDVGMIWNCSIGATPKINFLPIEAQKKLNIYYGANALPNDAQQPVQVAVKAAQSAYYYGVSPREAVHGSTTITALLTLPARTILERGGGLFPTFKEIGSTASPVIEDLASSGINGRRTNDVIDVATSAFTFANIGSFIQVTGDTAPYQIMAIDTEIVAHGDPLLRETPSTTSSLADVLISDDDQYASFAGSPNGGQDFLRIHAYVVDETPTVAGTYFARYYFTFMYNGYEESDPFLLVHCEGGSGKFPKASFSIQVEPALMDQNITGIRIYVATIATTTGITTYELWKPADTDFHLLTEVNIYDRNYKIAGDSTSTQLYWFYADPATYTDMSFGAQYPLRFAPWPFGYDFVMQQTNGASTLAGNLGHAVQKTRAYVKARYGTKVDRSQGSTVVIDEDDGTLRASSYDGDGVHEDDNFPQVSVDNDSVKQTIILTGSGELLGLQSLNSTVCAFRRTECETYDLQSGIQGKFSIDCISTKSIVKTPFGLVWAGSNGIYLLPVGGGAIQLLNPKWKNYYDGTLMISGYDKPYVSSTYRSAIVCGFDNTYQELWVHIQVNITDSTSEYLCFRYSFQLGKWFIRQLYITSLTTPVVCFNNNENGRLLIATSGKVVEYPSTDTVLMYQDDVTYAGATASHGVPVSLELTLGELYSLSNNFVLYSVILHGLGRVTDALNYRLSLYPQDSSTAFDQPQYPFAISGNENTVERLLTPIGQMDRVKIIIDIPSTTYYHYIKNWTISKISLGFIEQPRLGNS